MFAYPEIAHLVVLPTAHRYYRLLGRYGSHRLEVRRGETSESYFARAPCLVVFVDFLTFPISVSFDSTQRISVWATAF